MAAEKTATSISNASQTTLVPVWATVVPETVAEVSEAVRRSNGRLSVSSARYSPDTQFALAGALHIDISRLNRVIRFEPMDGIIRVQAGIRWHELLRFIQPHGFAVKVMPQFANFSIGGSVASNAHGHYVGIGPMSASIRSLGLVLADGSRVETSRSDKPDLFAAVVGGFGGVAVVVEVELELTENTRVMRKSIRLPAEQYVDHYKARIATDPGAVFHTAEFYAPSFRRLRATTWVCSEDRCTDDQPLNLAGFDDPLRKVFDWARPTSWFGRMREELIVEPIRYARKVVHWRNFEASHDLVELDARIHEDPSLELQEYVVSPAHAMTFLARLQDVVARYKVPAVYLSIRHYGRCGDSYLSLAERDSFAFLLAVRAKPVDSLKADYAVWSRELVDAALEGSGSFNPAYHMHATAEQFGRAFGRRAELLQAKRRYDPANRFGNGLWSRYLDDDHGADALAQGEVSEFRAAFAKTTSRDAVYRLLADCGPRGHAPRMLGLLERMSQRSSEDELIYRNMRSTLLKWRSSMFAALTMRQLDWQGALHRRLARYSREQLQGAKASDGKRLEGMLEVASGGKQLSALRRHFRIDGLVRQIDNFGHQFADGGSGWLESRMPARTAVGDAGQWDEQVLNNEAGSVDLVTLYGGLSGLPASQVTRCLAQLAKVVRPGGMVLLLEHDVETAHDGLEASLAVTLAYLCAGATWEASQAHPRAFRAADEWSGLMQEHGLLETGARERIPRTPFGDLLLAFQKPLPQTSA
jgi:FAD/FMN-containing dehydrogenase